RQGNLERARNTNHADLLLIFQRARGAIDQPVHDDGIVFACDDGKSIRHYLPLKSAPRFSRKAFVPSFMSSVAQHKPNRVASNSIPRSNASRQNFTASGALPIIFFAIACAVACNSACGTT